MRPQLPSPEVLRGKIETLSGEERRKAAEALNLIEEARRENPLLFYEPHGRQVMFHQSREPLKCFFGGNRSGKTTAGIVDDLIQALDPGWVPEHLREFKRWQPPFHCRVVTPDLTNTLEGVILQKIRDWCPPSQLSGGTVDKAYDAKMRMLKFANGSWMQFFSNDQDVDKFGGAALHRVHYDEEPRADIRSECTFRLIDHGGDELLTMTPLSGMSWTFSDIYEPWEQARENGQLDPGGSLVTDIGGVETKITVVLVDMDDNPHLDQTAKARALAGARTNEEREARKSGRFVHFAGLVYPEFSKHVHVIPEITEIPEGAEFFEGIDPGLRHPCGVVFAYLDPDGHMVVFDEIWEKGLTIGEIAKLIEHKEARWGTPRWRVIDPSARNKNNQTGRSDQSEFQDHGIYTIPGQNAKRPGISRVKERLQTPIDGVPALQVTANCTQLQWEFRRHRWSTPNRSENAPKEEVVKIDDDLLDPLRYVVMQRPLTPQRPKPAREIDRIAAHALKRLQDPQPVQHPSGPGIFA